MAKNDTAAVDGDDKRGTYSVDLAEALEAMRTSSEKQTATLTQLGRDFAQALADQNEKFLSTLEAVTNAAASMASSGTGRQVALADRPLGAIGAAFAGDEGQVLVPNPDDVVAFEPTVNPHTNKMGSRLHFRGGGSTRVAETAGEVASMLGHR